MEHRLTRNVELVQADHLTEILTYRDIRRHISRPDFL